jgi:hypothetical protein
MASSSAGSRRSAVRDFNRAAAARPFASSRQATTTRIPLSSGYKLCWIAGVYEAWLYFAEQRAAGLESQTRVCSGNNGNTPANQQCQVVRKRDDGIRDEQRAFGHSQLAQRQMQSPLVPSHNVTLFQCGTRKSLGSHVEWGGGLADAAGVTEKVEVPAREEGLSIVWHI